MIKGIALRATAILFTCILCLLIFEAPGYPKDKRKLKTGATGKLCITCHEPFKEILKRRYVHPLLKSEKCSSCHDPHTSSYKDLLTAGPTKLCYNCHKEILPEKARSSHKVVSQGDCKKCHDSHGSDNRFMLLKKGNELCYDCHKDISDKGAASRFKHKPLGQEKGCLNCHDPHASVKLKSLLKQEAPGLCRKCHNTGTQKFKLKHMNYPVADSSCTSCHDPHGSNTRGILFDGAHSAVSDKKCTECHENSNSPNALDTKKHGIELCRQCHEKEIDEAFSKNRLHWPLAGKVSCLNCHTPHAAKQKKLLKAPITDVCGKCHSDTVELQEWSRANPKNKKLCEPVKAGNCVVCHSPHAADYPISMNTKSISSELCGRCHEWQTHSTHPIGEKVIDQRNKNLSLDCLSGHNGCGTQNHPVMLHFPTTYDLCINCHTDRKR